MRLSALIFPFVISIAFNTCGKSPSNPKVPNHGEEVKYYVTIWTTYKHSITAWDNAMSNYNELMRLSNETEGAAISDSLVDNMHGSIKKYLNCVDSSLNKLNNIQSMDNDFHLLKNMTDNFLRSKKFWKENISVRVDFFRTGLSNLGDKESMQFESLGDDPENEKLIQDWNEIQNNLTDFRKVHNITTSDLKNAQIN